MIVVLFGMSLAVSLVPRVRAEEAAPAAQASSKAQSGQSASGLDPAPAQETSGWAGLRTWLTHLKEGLAKSAVERNYQNRGVAAVAAVRGAEQKLDDPNKPYVKDPAKSKAAKQLRAEKEEFAAAVDLLLAGKTDEGIAKLDEFEVKHPKSTLLRDVRDTRKRVKDAAAAKNP